MINEVFFNILRTSWQGSILALLVCGVLLILGKWISPRVRFLLIAVVLVRFLLPVTLPSSMSMFGLVPVASNNANSVSIIGESFSGEPRTQQTETVILKTAHEITTPSVVVKTVPQPTSTRLTDYVPEFSWYRLAVTIWCGGALFFAIRLVLDEYRLVKNRKNWQVAESPQLRRLVDECRKQAGLRLPVQVFITAEPVGAASCGIVRPAIVLSQDILDKFDTEELRLILLHESLHHKRFDPLTHFCAQVVKTLHWFNPVVYLLIKMFQNERELAVDESVVRLSGRQSAALYGNAILKAFRLYGKIVNRAMSPALFLGIQSQDKLLERRIIMILKPTHASLFRVAFGSLLILVIALIGLTDAQTVQKNTATEKQTAHEGDKFEVRFQFFDEAKQPVPEAEVCFFFGDTNPEEKIIVTDSEGRVNLSCSKEQYRSLQLVAISKDEKLSMWESFYAQGWGNTDGTTINKQFMLHKTEGRIITGTVKDSNGKPVEGAYVGGGADGTLPHYGKSKADGTFRFLYIGKSLLQVYAVKPSTGFAYHVTDEIDEWEGKTPPDKISDGLFHLVLYKPQNIQVRVTDEKGNPIPGAIVTSDMIFVSTKDKPTAANDVLHTLNLAPPAFFQKTNADGLATFDWIPTTNLKMLYFSARGSKEAVTMPDGTSKYFGQSQHAGWNKKDTVITTTLPQQTNIKIKFVNTDGSPALNVHSSVEWTSKTRPISAETVTVNENGEAEIFGNVGDILDIHSVGWTEDNFVFPTVGNFNIGDGSEVKELKLTAKKGTKIFGNIFDTDGKPMKWSEQYYISGWEINNPNVAKQLTQNETFGLGALPNDATAYEIYLPPGTFTFKIRLRNEHKMKPEERLFDEKTVTVGDEPVQLDLELHN
ncbi:MAG: M48 family metalloprotease [Planctomycetaceae bacterium]|jgi:beta-lactamase regulating signal transducer with metallopeptidase domain|nr:M48 family metalloprotease [Planctomycetaceae bacterium]